MIPPFNDDGYLPPGIHPATLEEVAERFGAGSEERVAQMQALRRAVALARQIGVRRFIVNGSFVTTKIDPVDVDCVLLLDEPEDTSEEEELLEGIPYLSAALVREDEFDEFVRAIFGSDQALVPKGMVEVIW